MDGPEYVELPLPEFLRERWLLDHSCIDEAMRSLWARLKARQGIEPPPGPRAIGYFYPGYAQPGMAAVVLDKPNVDGVRVVECREHAGVGTEGWGAILAGMTDAWEVEEWRVDRAAPAVIEYLNRAHGLNAVPWPVLEGP